jgi:hypothetical protein
LLGCPLEAIYTILPEDFLPDIGQTTPEQFTGILLHSQFSGKVSLFFSVHIFVLSHFLTNPLLNLFVHSQTGRTVAELPEAPEHQSARSFQDVG